jgi:hypothetical protein
VLTMVIVTTFQSKYSFSPRRVFIAVSFQRLAIGA